MVYINIFSWSFGHFWRENCAISDSFGKIPKASAGLGLEKRCFFLNESLINKLYEYEEIFEFDCSKIAS